MKIEFKTSLDSIQRCISHNEKKGMVLSPEKEAINTKTILEERGYLYFQNKN